MAPIPEIQIPEIQVEVEMAMIPEILEDKFLKLPLLRDQLFKKVKPAKEIVWKNRKSYC